MSVVAVAAVVDAPVSVWTLMAAAILDSEETAVPVRSAAVTAERSVRPRQPRALLPLLVLVQQQEKEEEE